jgi:hypothetical protein
VDRVGCRASSLRTPASAIAWGKRFCFGSRIFFWIFADSCGRIPGILEHRGPVDKAFLQFGQFSDFGRESDMHSARPLVAMREAILATSTKRRRLRDAYRFVGFRPLEHVRGMFGDRHARIIRLVRRSKKRPAAVVGRCGRAGTTARSAGRAIWPAGACASSLSSRCGASIACAAAR